MTTLDPKIERNVVLADDPTSMRSADDKPAVIDSNNTRKGDEKKAEVEPKDQNTIPPDAKSEHDYKRRGRPDKPVAAGKPQERPKPKPKPKPRPK